MASYERERESVSAVPNEEQIRKRAAAGWRVAAIEWEREAKPQPIPVRSPVEIPYGLRVSADCFHLEEDPEERRNLVVVMDCMVDDRPLSHAVNELNQRGARTRAGRDWTSSDVFNLLPRLIEAGPKIFASPDWAQQRQRRAHAS